MRLLLTGKNGMLARDLIEVLENLPKSTGIKFVAYNHAELPCDDWEAVRDKIDANIDVVINLAAWTNVDQAETEEAKAFVTNAVAPSLLALRCREVGARLVHYSTDYVFDGEGSVCRVTGQRLPYATNSRLMPLGAYGRTKAAGEWALRANCADYLILRTAWLYGARGKCFPKTIKRLLDTRDEVQVVSDQVGSPTWTKDVARLTLDLIQAKAPTGIYHATSAGKCSWFEFAKEIATVTGHDLIKIKPVSSAQFAAAAPRPSWSVLSHECFATTGVAPIGDWKQRFHAAYQEVFDEC